MSSSPDYEEKREKRSDSAARKPGEESLDPSLASRVKDSLGEDVAHVRIHTGPDAREEAERHGARAVTREKDIYFARDAFDPETESGLRLLAHEMAHTIQQTGSATQGGDRRALEAEADSAADAVMRGVRGPVHLKGARGEAQRQEKGKTEGPSIRKHPEEIAPTPGRGTIGAAGATISYLYATSAGASFVNLVLQVPDGVALVVTPFTDLREGVDYRVQNAGGTRARSVVISVSNQLVVPPKVQATFSKGSAGYIVIFQFPSTAKK
jgi:hypothetical protein